MTTTTAHPMQLAGPARARWCAATGVRVVLNLAALAGFAWVATYNPLPPFLNDAQIVLAAAVLIAGHALNRWLMWLAWAEVPGAYGRTRRAEPLPDRLVTIALNLAVVPLAVWLTTQHPGGEGLLLIALVGSFGTLLFAARLAMRLVRKEAPSRIAAAASGLVAAVALLLASNAASFHAARPLAFGMAVIYAVTLAVIRLLRHAQ